MVMREPSSADADVKEERGASKNLRSLRFLWRLLAALPVAGGERSAGAVGCRRHGFGPRVRAQKAGRRRLRRRQRGLVRPGDPGASRRGARLGGGELLPLLSGFMDRRAGRCGLAARGLRPCDRTLTRLLRSDPHRRDPLAPDHGHDAAPGRRRHLRADRSAQPADAARRHRSPVRHQRQADGAGVSGHAPGAAADPLVRPARQAAQPGQSGPGGGRRQLRRRGAEQHPHRAGFRAPRPRPLALRRPRRAGFRDGVGAGAGQGHAERAGDRPGLPCGLLGAVDRRPRSFRRQTHRRRAFGVRLLRRRGRRIGRRPQRGDRRPAARGRRLRTARGTAEHAAHDPRAGTAGAAARAAARGGRFRPGGLSLPVEKRSLGPGRDRPGGRTGGKRGDRRALRGRQDDLVPTAAAVLRPAGRPHRVRRRRPAQHGSGGAARAHRLGPAGAGHLLGRRLGEHPLSAGPKPATTRW